MGLGNDLLEQAHHLARREKKKPKQASLRRAVSTAYYALFHLLIAEAVSNWKNSDQRPALGRAFEHGRMNAASMRVAAQRFAGEDPGVVSNLKAVANAFARLQHNRHKADYDTSAQWSRSDVLAQIQLAEDAFACWREIRGERVAQDYLLSLLVRDR